MGISNTAENLWFLMHFKKLEILNTVIYHQQYSELEDYKFNVTPDQFWSEERLEKWKEDVNKKDNVDEMLAPEDTSFDFVGSPFPTNEIDIKAPF